MTLHEAIELFKDHQKDNAKEKTRESYGYLFRNLETLLEDGPLDAISPQDLYQFLLLLTEGRARSTARLRYAQLKSFFNFIIEGTHTSMTNPCNDPLLSKTFRAPRVKQREIIGREVVDEIIYPVQKDEGQTHPRAPGPLRVEDRGGAGSTGIGRERKKTHLKATQVGEG
jgi:integrase